MFPPLLSSVVVHGLKAESVMLNAAMQVVAVFQNVTSQTITNHVRSFVNDSRMVSVPLLALSTVKVLKVGGEKFLLHKALL